jgi:hypothetical protein
MVGDGNWSQIHVLILSGRTPWPVPCGFEPISDRRGWVCRRLSLDDAEPDLDEVHPGGVGRSEVDLEAGVRPEPVPHVLVLVGGVVVHDQVQLNCPASASTMFREVRSTCL